MNRRQSSQRRRPSPPLPQSAGDLFRFFEGEDSGDDDASRSSQKRSASSDSRSTRRFPKKAEEEEIILEEEELDDTGLYHMDDTVDDGFFARYRKEVGTGQRITDYSSLDASEDGASGEARKPRGTASRRIDRETAASAFDAVDKLFGSINLEKNSDSRRGTARQRQRQVGGREKDKVKRKQIDREKWLADVKARASTQGDNAMSAGKFADDSTTVDVSAVEDLTDDDHLTPQSGDEGVRVKKEGREDDFEEADIDGDAHQSDVIVRKSGFRAQSGGAVPEPSESDAQPFEGAGTDSSAGKLSDDAKEPEEPTFRKLMAMARRGPNAGISPRRKEPPVQRPTRTSGSMNRAGNELKGKRTETKGISRRPRDDERASSSKPDISRLLGLTKQIVSSQKEKHRDGAGEEYEEVDDDMEKSIVIKGAAVGRRGTGRRQKYTAVRRIANRSFRIHSPPEEWGPLTEQDVAKVRSDSRSIGRSNGSSKGKGIVADCGTCRGAGLETCSTCLGNGWVPPLTDNNIKGHRRELLEKIWNRPNVCVDSLGEAQCVMCNGIGKQLCDACKGSGSALKKGFSPSEKNEIFDIFPEDDDAFAEEDEYADDDEDDESGDLEDFQLYTGPEEPYDIETKSPSLGDETDELGDEPDEMNITNVVGEDLDVDDESAELLATLEAMHLADLEEGGPEYMNRLKRRGVVPGDDDDDDDEEDDEVDEEDEDVDVDIDEDDFDMVLEGDDGEIDEDENVIESKLSIEGIADEDDELDNELDDDDDDDDIVDDI